MTSPAPPRVAIIAGARTPFAKAGTAFARRSALDLSVHAVDGLLVKHAPWPTKSRGAALVTA